MTSFYVCYDVMRRGHSVHNVLFFSPCRDCQDTSVLKSLCTVKEVCGHPLYSVPHEQTSLRKRNVCVCVLYVCVCMSVGGCVPACLGVRGWGIKRKGKKRLISFHSAYRTALGTLQ